MDTVEEPSTTTTTTTTTARKSDTFWEDHFGGTLATVAGDAAPVSKGASATDAAAATTT